jgi:AcrR family transcriptional regulator
MSRNNNGSLRLVKWVAMSDGARPGRPRSDDRRRAILDAAIAELEERGYAAMTVERIAARAQAGKQTIYRWWPSKAEVVLEAMLERAEQTIALPDTGNLRADLEAFLSATFRQRHQRPLLVGLMSEALRDDAFHRAFREQFLFERRAALRSVLERAAARGELSADADLELLIDIAFGVSWYRLMLAHAPLDARLATELASFISRSAGATA